MGGLLCYMQQCLRDLLFLLYLLAGPMPRKPALTRRLYVPTWYPCVDEQWWDANYSGRAIPTLWPRASQFGMEAISLYDCLLSPIRIAIRILLLMAASLASISGTAPCKKSSCRWSIIWGRPVPVLLHLPVVCPQRCRSHSTERQAAPRRGDRCLHYRHDCFNARTYFSVGVLCLTSAGDVVAQTSFGPPAMAGGREYVNYARNPLEVLACLATCLFDEFGLLLNNRAVDHIAKMHTYRDVGGRKVALLVVVLKPHEPTGTPLRIGGALLRSRERIRETLQSHDMPCGRYGYNNDEREQKCTMGWMGALNRFGGLNFRIMTQTDFMTYAMDHDRLALRQLQHVDTYAPEPLVGEYLRQPFFPAWRDQCLAYL